MTKEKKYVIVRKKGIKERRNGNKHNSDNSRNNSIDIIREVIQGDEQMKIGNGKEAIAILIAVTTMVVMVISVKILKERIEEEEAVIECQEIN